MFGRDILERFAESGLVPTANDDLLEDLDAERYGLNPSEQHFLLR